MQPVLNCEQWFISSIFSFLSFAVVGLGCVFCVFHHWLLLVGGMLFGVRGILLLMYYCYV